MINHGTGSWSLPQAVVGLGLAEGNPDACIELLRALPADTGMTFFVVPPASDNKPGLLEALRAQVKQIPVVEALDGAALQPGAVYVSPPHKSLRFKGRRVCLKDSPAGPHLPIDRFFESLAENHGARAIGVVLSGAGSDGRQGVQAIKAAGGISFAQDGTAVQRSRPQSAVSTGCVDFVLPPQDIALKLTDLATLPQLAFSNEPIAPGLALDSVFRQLQEHCRIDFSEYQASTLHRRIRRRMALRGIDSLAPYAETLRHDPAECETLCQDLMVNVTAFFRDPQSFEALKAAVFAPLLKVSSNEPLRVWVVGCASGEEAYSIAIALREYMREHGIERPVRIFGTDANSQSLARARRAWYADNIVEGLPPQIRERYFVKMDDGYCVNKVIREFCTFAQHNVIADPPFHRMDLVSCRNLLIHFQAALQRKLLPLLHFALKPQGFVFLGAAESINHYRELFEQSDARHQIYSTRPAGRQILGVVASAFAGPTQREPSLVQGAPVSSPDGQRIADWAALKAYAPPGVLVDEEGRILHYRGDVSPYLSQLEGRPTHNILKVAREGLLAPLSAALKEAIARGASVRREEAVVLNNEGLFTLALHVLPVVNPAPQAASYWVFFEPSVATFAHHALIQAKRLDSEHDISRQLEVLTDELTATRQYLEATIESQATLNENLQVANEEIQSSNEELQSSNEELESSKEEIHSSNEELLAVNDELRLRNLELDQANDDLVNLFGGIEMAIVMVWRDLRIRRFTPSAAALFSVLPTDIGRSIADIRHHFQAEDFPQLVLRCIQEACDIEQQVTGTDGRCFLMRIRPYRTHGGAVEGAMVMFIDIDTLARAQRDLDGRVAELAAFDRHKNEFLAILAHELRNPLAPMRNAVQVLKRKANHNDEAAIKARDMIDRQVQHMSRLVSDLLDAARAQHGRIRLQRAVMDLRISIEQVVEQLRPTLQGKSQTIVVRLPDEPVWIEGDCARLEQIFMNLLSNASKFTQPGGALEVRLEAEQLEGAGLAIARVCDNGEGLETETLSGLFQLFTQADRSLAHSQGGLGIGLSLVRTLVSLHGGQVSARSEGAGRGSTFEVRLPRCAPPPISVYPDHPLALDALPKESHGRRVLVVEDNPDIRDSSCELLSLCGFEVLGVGSGSEALHRAPGFAPDAVLLDVGLPDMDGYEVARRLRGSSQFSETLMVALTGYDSPEARSQSAASGFNHHLTKPVNFDDLAGLLMATPG